MLDIFKGNLSPSVSDTITINNVAFDLTNCTVKFCMRAEDSDVLKVNAAATIVSAPAGTVRYDWSGTDTDTSGDYVCWWSVTLASGLVQDSPEFALTIREHGPAATDLCDLFDVRSSMQLPASATATDDTIQDYITIASNIIQAEYGHFAPIETGTTHRFRVRRNRAKFFPYFLRSATSVVLSPESLIQTLDPNTPDYLLEPYETLDGVYTSLRISAFIPIQISPTALRFGNALLDVTGDWGFATVPDAVRLATIITIRAWLRRDMSTFTNIPSFDGELVPQVQGTYSIPMAARDHLALYTTVDHVY